MKVHVSLVSLLLLCAVIGTTAISEKWRIIESPDGNIRCNEMSVSVHPYVVFTEHRSGSTWLSCMLASQPCSINFKEHWSITRAFSSTTPARVVSNQSRWSPRDQVGWSRAKAAFGNKTIVSNAFHIFRPCSAEMEAAPVMTRHPEKRMAWHCTAKMENETTTCPAIAVGLKSMLRYDSNIVKNPENGEWTAGRDSYFVSELVRLGIRVVFHKRNNALDQLISWEHVDANGRMHCKSAKECSGLNTKVVLPTAALVDKLNTLTSIQEAAHQWAHEVLAPAGVPFIMTDYDTFSGFNKSRSAGDAWADVFEFVGIPMDDGAIFPPKSLFIKRHHMDHRSILRNYDAVAETLRGTKFEMLL